MISLQIILFILFGIICILYFYINNQKENLSNIKAYNSFNFLFNKPDSSSDIYIINNKKIPNYNKSFVKINDYKHITDLLSDKLTKYLNVLLQKEIQIKNIYNIYQKSIDKYNTEYIFNVFIENLNSVKYVLLYLNYNKQINDIIIYNIKKLSNIQKYKEYNNIDNQYIINNTLNLMYPFKTL